MGGPDLETALEETTKSSNSSGLRLHGGTDGGRREIVGAFDPDRGDAAERRGRTIVGHRPDRPGPSRHDGGKRRSDPRRSHPVEDATGSRAPSECFVERSASHRCQKDGRTTIRVSATRT